MNASIARELTRKFLFEQEHPVIANILGWVKKSAEQGDGSLLYYLSERDYMYMRELGSSDEFFSYIMTHLSGDFGYKVKRGGDTYIEISWFTLKSV